MIPPSDLPTRAPWLGTRQILSYNRGMYAVAGLAILALAGMAFVGPAGLRVVAVVLASAVLLAVTVSLLVPHVVYDVSPLHRWTWLTPHLAPPRRILVVHAGLDEASAELAAVYPNAQLEILDIYDKDRMTEPAIHIARRTSASAPSRRASFDELGLAHGSFDLAILFMTAHELRKAPERQRLLQGLRNGLAPGGTLVVVEHLRNAANLLAFGPGAFHFYGDATWRRDFEAAGWRVHHAAPITPFVRAYMLAAPT